MMPKIGSDLYTNVLVSKSKKGSQQKQLKAFIYGGRDERI